jgi:hypothetical protein
MVEVMLAGVATIGVGLYQLWAYSGKFHKTCRAAIFSRPAGHGVWLDGWVRRSVVLGV